MSPLPSFLTSPPPSVGVEIASDRVTAVSLARQGPAGSSAPTAPNGSRRASSRPALNAVNVHDARALSAALRSAFDKLGAAPAPHRAGHSRHGREALAAALREGPRARRISTS